MKKLFAVAFLYIVAFIPTKAQNCADTIFLSPQYEFDGTSLVVSYFPLSPLTSLTSFQIGLIWDDVFGFKSIKANSVLDNNNLMTHQLSANTINILWMSADGKPVTANQTEPLFSCTFDVYDFEALGSIQQSDFLNELVEDPLTFTYNCLHLSNEPAILNFGKVTGSVSLDIDKNCIKDPDAVAFRQGLLKFTKNGKDFFRIVDSLGNYTAYLSPGQYEVSMVLNESLYSVCNPDELNIVVAEDGINTGVDFLVQRDVDCAVIETHIEAAFLRRCFDNTYTLSYENVGSIVASNAKIEVILDEDMSFVSSTFPQTIQDSIITFELGDVEVGEKSTIKIVVNLDCNTATLGETHCVTAKSFPNDPCVIPLNYAGSHIKITGECDEMNKKVKFKLTNIGVAPTPFGMEFIVIEDEVMKPPVNYSLQAQESYLIEFEADGTTYSIVSQQEANFPGLSRPRAFIEGCGTNAGGTFSTGFINNFGLDDLDPYIDISCIQNIGSYDPNDITGLPKGYGTPKYIENTTKLEYLVRFQNTGTDTAFNIIVRNIIPAEFDISTFKMGTSSHEYTYEFLNERELVVRYKNIQLVDSFKNEALSHGFFKYEIFPLGTLIDEQILNNKADIYFDFNVPIQTNIEKHTIGRPLLISSIINVNKDVLINAFPIPTDELINIVLPDERIYTYSVVDIFGQLKLKGTIHKSRNQINCWDLSPGVYMINVDQENQKISTIKFIKK